MDGLAKKYLDQLSSVDIGEIAEICLERLIEIEEVSFRIPIPDENVEECFYWNNCGDSLVD